jgi:membrane protein DedA with SNARE-associated domain
VHVLETVGYPAIFVVAMLEAICIPFPSEITFGFTAALAAQGKGGFHLAAVILVGIAGEVCGSIIAYLIGKKAGRPAVDRWGKYVLLTHSDLDRADAFMARRGMVAVAVGRVVPLLRAFVSLAAGIGEMPFARFVVATVIGTSVYVTGVACIGYALGDSWHRIVRGFTVAGALAAVAAAVVVAVAIYHRWQHVRRDQEARQAAQAQAQAQAQPEATGTGHGDATS